MLSGLTGLEGVETMFQIITNPIKWSSLPALLIGCVFSQYAVSYELLVNSLFCLSAVAFSVQWAVRSGEYFWAAAFVGIAVLFSPLLLVVKIFLLLGLVCVVTLATLVAAFQTQPAVDPAFLSGE